MSINMNTWKWPAVINNGDTNFISSQEHFPQKKKKKKGKWNSRLLLWQRHRTRWSDIYDYQAQAIFLSLSLLLFLSALLLYCLSPSQRMTRLVQPRPGSIVQFHTCLLYWHLSEHIFPLNISPHIILHFLYNDMLSLISLCKPFLGPRKRIQ